MSDFVVILPIYINFFLILQFCHIVYVFTHFAKFTTIFCDFFFYFFFLVILHNIHSNIVLCYFGYFVCHSFVICKMWGFVSYFSNLCYLTNIMHYCTHFMIDIGQYFLSFFHHFGHFSVNLSIHFSFICKALNPNNSCLKALFIL